MNDVIASRVELLWAKIAGRNVNINTMTPAVAANMTEKLMLEAAERIDGISDDIPSAATASAAGVVKMAANVAEAAGATPTAEEFKALLDALIAAGIMSAPADSE